MTDGHKKDTADEQNFGGGSIRFHPLKKLTKIGNNLRERNGIEWTLVVWSGDVKRVIIGSLTDESEWKWVTGVICEAHA